MKKLLILASILAILLTTKILANDLGSSIALNFGADEIAGSHSEELRPADSAGAVPQANWNNLFLRAGTASSLVTDVLGKPIGSSVSVTWSSPNTWSTTAGGPNNGFPAGPDRTLMTGYLDTDEGTGVATVTVSGLGPDFTHASYDVIVYVLGGGAGSGGAYTIGSTTLFGTSPANRTTHVEDPGVGLSDTGTYVVFRNLSGESFTLTASANAADYPPNSVNFRAPIDGIQIVSRAIQNVFRPVDPVLLVNGVNDGDANAGPPPSFETVDHAIDGLLQKYLNFLDLGSGFATTPSLGSTIARCIRFYTANDAEERDPASYVLEGSSAGITGPWTTIASGPLALPSGRNPGGDIPIDPLTQFNQLIAFPNAVPYSSYRVTFPTLKNSGVASSMQIGEVELLGFRPNHCPTADAMSVVVLPDTPLSFQVHASDPENDALTYVITEYPSHGVAGILSSGSAGYFPTESGYCGPDRFKYKVNDGTCDSPEATVSITVGDGTPPTLACPANISVVGTSSAGNVINYPDPIVTRIRSCTIADVNCSPPSGSTFPLGTTTVVCTATDSVGNSGTCSFTVTVQSADVFITKSVDQTTAKAGQTLTYSINVKNVGTASAAGVVVNDPIPQEASFFLASATQGTFTAPPVGAVGTVTWNAGNLAVGASASLKLQVKVSARGKDLVVNTATVKSSTLDSNLDNNTATITTRRKAGK